MTTITSGSRTRKSDFVSLVSPSVLGMEGDVARIRERHRRRRLRKVLLLLCLPLAWCLWRDLTHQALVALPHFGGTLARYLPGILMLAVLVVIMASMFVAGGFSPHTLYRPAQIDVGLDDVVGIDHIKSEVVRSLNLFLGYKKFQALGGMPRRGVLFEGPPGTGKTLLAKAMAKEADVPFLFVAGSSFQSHFYGMTGRKIRSFFKALRKYARAEGGAIAFVDELDAVGASRVGMSGRGEGIAGTVNTLLTELQSFDDLTAGQRLVNRLLIEPLNRLLPARLQLPPLRPDPANVLILAATNRADHLDAALTRPGRFDRSLHFALPSRDGRAKILAYYLERVSHDPTMDVTAIAERVAGMTPHWSPAALARLVNTALVVAIANGRIAEMGLADIVETQLELELGMEDPGECTEEERRRVAFHEAGHATVAYYLGEGRMLDVLSIIRRRGSLGLLLHSDADERFTQTQPEMETLVRIAMGGKAAEQIFYGNAGSGPAGDLVTATKVAAQMVGIYGMGRSLISAAAGEGAGPFAPGIVDKVLADRKMRAEVDALLAGAYVMAEELLRQHRAVVVALAEALLERRQLVGSEITDVIEQVPDAGRGKATANRELDALALR